MRGRASAPPTRKKSKPTRAETRRKQQAHERSVLAKLRREGEVWFTQDFRRYRVVQATPIEDGLVLARVNKRLRITSKTDRSQGTAYSVGDGEGGLVQVQPEHLFGLVVEEHLRMPPRSRRVITIRDVFLETPAHFEIWLPTRKGADRRCVYRRLMTAIEKIRAAGFGGYQLGKRIVWFAKKTTPKRRKVGRRRGSRLAMREAATVSP